MRFDLKKLKDDMTGTLKDMDGLRDKIAEAEGKNDAEAVKKLQAEFDGKSATFERLSKQVDEAKADAARRARLNDVDDLAKPVEGKSIPTSGPAEPKDEDKAERELEGHFLEAITGKAIPDQARMALTPASKKWDKCVDGLRMPKRFAKSVLPEAFEGKALPMTSVTNTGNKLVFTDTRAELQMYEPQTPTLCDRTNRWPIKAGNSKIEYPQLDQGAGSTQFGGVSVGRTDEGADATSGEAKFIQANIEAFELSGYTELSKTLLGRSAIDVEEILRRLFRSAILFAVDSEVLVGDGVKKCLGILDASVGITMKARAVTGDISYEDFVRVEHGVLPQLRPGCVWALADTALEAAKLMTDATGRPLFVPDIRGNPGGTLLGYPVVPNYQRTLGQAGDVVFGNFQQYVCVMEQEVVVSSSEHFKFSKGVVAYRVGALIGGRPIQSKAFAALDA